MPKMTRAEQLDAYRETVLRGLAGYAPSFSWQGHVDPMPRGGYRFAVEAVAMDRGRVVKRFRATATGADAHEGMLKVARALATAVKRSSR